MDTAITYTAALLAVLFPYAILALVVTAFGRRGKQDALTILRLTNEIIAFKNPVAEHMAIQRAAHLTQVESQFQEADRAFDSPVVDPEDYAPEDGI